MKILFVGGDKRSTHMITDFLEAEYDVFLLGFEDLEVEANKVKMENLDISDYDVIIFPVSGVYDDYTVKTEYNQQQIDLPINFLGNSKEGCVIFSGILTDRLSELLRLVDKEAYLLMKKSDIVDYNSIITCEGILQDIIDNTNITIHNSNIMVIGYGHVGKRLVDVLNKLGANITVVVKEEEDYEALTKENIETLYVEDINNKINNQQIIINTAPAKVLRSENLQNINKDTYLLDIASLPGGIDFKSAEKHGIKYKHFLGIPSITAPKSAGKILSKKIQEVIKKEENDG